MALPRILYAVPPLPHVYLEIAKAIQTLAAGDDERIEAGAADPIQSQRDHELIAGIVRDAWKILGKTGYNPNELRVPAGNPDGGQWTTEGSGDQADALEQYLPTPRPTTIGYRALSTRSTILVSATIKVRRLKSRLKFRRGCWRRGRR